MIINIIRKTKTIISKLKLAFYGVTISDKFLIFMTIIGRFFYLIISLAFPFLRKYIGKLNFPLKDVMLKIPKFGIKIFCRKHFDDIAVIDPVCDEEVMKHIKNLKCKVFVDIGAHIGKYSLIVAKSNPKAKIISIEANPDTFKILKKNIELNNLKNITALNLAAYSKTAELTFYSIKYFSSLSSIYDYDISKIYDITKGKKVKIIIKARKLDDILKKLKIKNVDIMKLNVEKSEPEVFKGATKILKNKNLIIFFEAWNEYYLKKCENILKKFGYHIKPVTDTMYIASRK